MTPTGNGPKVEIQASVDSQGSLKQIHDAVSAIKRSVDLTGGAFASYEKRLGKILKDLDAITREGSNAGQTVRDLALAGGGTVAGRVRQSNANSRKSAIAQTEEVLVADAVNFQANVYKNVARSVKSALIASLAKSKQDLANVDAEIRAAQIAAQRARVGFATQLSGTRGNVRGTITENANALGIQNLGTLRSEQAALDKLLAGESAYKAQIAQVNGELRQQEQLMGKIASMSNSRLTPMRQQIEALQKQNAIERENLNIYKATQRGDNGAVLKGRLKQESLRLDQMALRGVKEESAEFQKQLGLIASLNAEQQRLNESRKVSTKELRDQARLQESRDFAKGGGANREVMQNNIIGARRLQNSDESRASLLGMQGNLLMNYGLLGGGVAAIGAMTAGVVDLDAKLRELQAIAGATNREFEGLRSVVIKTSEDTKFSAVELAEASVMLAQVGQSVREIEDTLPVISAFAMAVGTDMKNAVDIVTTSLTVFNMNTDQTQRITNVLTEALNRSKLSMDQLVLGFQYSANIAADSGVTFEELTATLAGMSQAGIRSGSMLGTGLRQIMISLANPTEEIIQLVSDLGLTMNDVDIKTQGLTGVLANFAEAGLTAGDAMGAFETRTAAALVAATNQVDFIRQVQEQFTFTRAAEEAAAKQSESFKNSMLELKNEFMSFMNDAARPVLQMLIVGAKTMKEFGDSIGPAIPLLKALTATLIIAFGAASIASIVKLGAAFISYSGILGGVGGMATAAAAAHTAFIVSINTGAAATVRATLAMRAFTLALPLVGIITALGAGFYFLYQNMNQGESSAKTFTDALDEQQTAFNESKAAQDKYQQVLSQIEQTIARLKQRSDSLKDGSEALRIEVLNGASTFNEYGASIDSTNTRLVEYINQLEGAKEAVRALAEEQARQAAIEAAKAQQEATNNFQSSFIALKPYTSTEGPGGRAVAEAVAGNRLTAQEETNITNAFNILKSLGAQEYDQLDTGELQNLMTNSQVLINLLTKAGTGAGAIERLNSVRFSTATLMAARGQNQQAQVNAGGMALLSNPDWQAFRNREAARIAPLGNLTGDMSASARANREDPAERLRASERIIAQYGATFRKITTELETARETYFSVERTPEQRYAFEQVMNPVNDELVRIREVLINTQRENDALALRNLQALQPLVANAPSSDIDALKREATAGGLTIPDTVRNKSEFEDWISREISRRSSGVNVETLLGRGGFATWRQSVEEDTIAQGGRVAQRERIPMAQRIRDMATEYGLSPDLMRNVASYETGGRFNADATNPESTARGLFQIMAATWNEKRPDQQVSTRIADRNPNDPRLDPEQNMVFAMEEMTSRIAQMTENLGRRPEDWEMYLAWQQGVRGATNILQNPDANLAATVGGQEAALNAGAGLNNRQFAANVRQTYARQAGNASNESMRSLGEAAEAMAEEARKNLESVADGARTVATTAKNLATRTLRNLGSNTSDENAAAAVTEIGVALQEVEDQTGRYYRLRIDALIKYRDSMDAAARLTPERLAELNTEIQDLMNARDNEMERVQEDSIAAFTSMYTKLPQFAGSITNLVNRTEDSLTALMEAFNSIDEMTTIQFQEANERIAAAVDQRRVAFGTLSGAEANARSVLRGRAANYANEQLMPAQFANATMMQSQVTGSLDSQLGNTGMTLRDVDLARLRAEQEKLTNMNRENTQAYGEQQALVQVMEANLAKAVEYRTQERDLMIEMEALGEALGENEQLFSDRLKLVVEGWAEEKGVFKSMMTDVLDGIPGVLDATQGAFSTFFSDIMSGTATVGDAFRAMGATILKAMMDVVASEAAKQMMRLVLQLANAIWGGGNWNPSGTPFGGGPAPEFYREGGLIHAATGYGPVRGRDSVDIKAMPGEYVLRKSAVDAIGVDNLNQINAQGNKINSSALAAKPVIIAPQGKPERPLEVYVVSPDKQPPPTRDQIIVMVQEDMINRGPVYKTTKAIQSGAI